jgi:hypothetical protein
MLWSFLYLIPGRFFQFLVLLGAVTRPKRSTLGAWYQVASFAPSVNHDLNDGDCALLAALAAAASKSHGTSFVTPATLL